MHGDTIRLVSIRRLSAGDGGRRIATSPRTIAAGEQGTRTPSHRRVQGRQAVAVEHAVDRAGSRVQTMIAAGLGEVAHSGDVAVGGKQPASGPSLLGRGPTLDGPVSVVTRKPAHLGVDDDRLPSCSVLA